jgi:hypothetical protein
MRQKMDWNKCTIDRSGNDGSVKLFWNELWIGSFPSSWTDEQIHIAFKAMDQSYKLGRERGIHEAREAVKGGFRKCP